MSGQEKRPYDLVLFGATGFTGHLTARYLAAQAARRPFRWAMAGRNEQKLRDLRAKLLRELSEEWGPDAGQEAIGIIVANSNEPASLQAMAAQTDVLATTVGPYEKYGEPLVKACVDAGTHYVDITGESSFVSRMLATYDEAAKAAGIRIIHCCGFDSIPHDMGAYFVMTQLPPDLPITLKGIVQAKGGFSGGTWQTAVNALAGKDAVSIATPVRPIETSGRQVKRLPARIYYDRTVNKWVCPLPTIDPQIVRRSARALDAYGPNFRYGHYIGFKSFWQMLVLLTGVVDVAVLARFGPTRRWLLKQRPAGTGPNRDVRLQGWFKVTFIAEIGQAPPRPVAIVAGGEPGYTETAKMLSEAALCLLFDQAELPDEAGVLTTAVGLGQPLLMRLQAAGIKFQMIPEENRAA